MKPKFKTLLFALMCSPIFAQSQNPSMGFYDYTFAATWQPAQCQSQRDNSKECQESSDYLTAHGLWPSMPKVLRDTDISTAAWYASGCGIFEGVTTYKKPGESCSFPLVISPVVKERLGKYMPASVESSGGCLHKYEFAKHAQCFNFNPDDYFSTISNVMEKVSRSGFVDFLIANKGKTVEIAKISEKFYTALGLDSKKFISLAIGCKKYESSDHEYFYELQVRLKNTPLPFELTDYAFSPSDSQHVNLCQSQTSVYIDDWGLQVPK